MLDKEYSNVSTKDKEDKWYNMLSDLSNNKDNTVALSLTLPIHSAMPLLTAVVISLVTHKEHSTSARIKVVYMLKDKKSPLII